MQNKIELPSFTLLMMISFASVNAVLFTPALPAIAKFFAITSGKAQQTMSLFLIGYALGQLIYGPVANRWGRKPALYLGIALQIFSSLLCVVAGMVHMFPLLLIGRFLLALGSGVGLKMTFTLVNEAYTPKEASAKTSYLMLSFAITPGLAIALGGVLQHYFGWYSCFYAGVVYGLLLLLLVIRLPETLKTPDQDALKFSHLWHNYQTQFKNSVLVAGGFLMGLSTSFVYVFAALAPFIAINLYGMSSKSFGFASIIPPVGLLIGSLFAARYAKLYSLLTNIRWGCIIATLAVVLMTIAILMKLHVLLAIFVPTMLIYFGLCFVISNSSAIAMSQVTDKAHGSAVMSFINMGIATLVVLGVGLFHVKTLLLPITFSILCFVLIIISQCIINPEWEIQR